MKVTLLVCTQPASKYETVPSNGNLVFGTIQPFEL